VRQSDVDELIDSIEACVREVRTELASIARPAPSSRRVALGLTKPGDAGGGTDGSGVRPSVSPTLADIGI